jgi:hypothetical protein
MSILPLLWKAVWRLLKNLKGELPSIPFLVIHLKEYVPVYNKATCTPMHVYCSIIHNSQTLETAQMPHN